MNPMKKETLFLDFDGPLFPSRWVRYHAGNNKPYQGRVKMTDRVNYWVMDPMSVELLNFLHNIFPFQTVVSSSWRRFVTKEQCEDLFLTNGLKLHLADNWCTAETERRMSDYKCYRAPEIKEYINKNKITEYLILDDDGSGSSLREVLNGEESPLNKNRIVLVDEDLGIGSNQHRSMLSIVKQWAGIKPTIWETMLW